MTDYCYINGHNVYRNCNTLPNELYYYVDERLVFESKNKSCIVSCNTKEEARDVCKLLNDYEDKVKFYKVLSNRDNDISLEYKDVIDTAKKLTQTLDKVLSVK